MKTNYRCACCCENCEYVIHDEDFFTYCNQDHSAVRSEWEEDKKWKEQHYVVESMVCDDFLDVC